jgi:hypothetical protein
MVSQILAYHEDQVEVAGAQRSGSWTGRAAASCEQRQGKEQEQRREAGSTPVISSRRPEGLVAILTDRVEPKMAIYTISCGFGTAPL